MRWVLFILAAGAFLIGIIVSLTATTVFQTIVGAMAFVVWAILLGSAAVVDALVDLKQEVLRRGIGGPGTVERREAEQIRTARRQQDSAQLI